MNGEAEEMELLYEDEEIEEPGYGELEPCGNEENLEMYF
jgi:hypothetical protein